MKGSKGSKSCGGKGKGGADVMMPKGSKAPTGYGGFGKGKKK